MDNTTTHRNPNSQGGKDMTTTAHNPIEEARNLTAAMVQDTTDGYDLYLDADYADGDHSGAILRYSRGHGRGHYGRGYWLTTYDAEANSTNGTRGDRYQTFAEAQQALLEYLGAPRPTDTTVACLREGDVVKLDGIRQVVREVSPCRLNHKRYYHLEAGGQVLCRLYNLSRRATLCKS
jgi:hypothetical protein